MTQLALDEYTREIDGMLGRESYDEAIAHCLHVVHQFSKHLETYRQLGKALLEKGQHGDASDVFQRILSADPNDFVAHVGLAIIREEDDQLDQALWHMERAFELAPSNAAVQGELRRLYGRRGGVEPTRMRLTRGALARQYLQGDLYGPAIAELKSQLASEPDRMDLQVVLAEALWRDQQRIETQDRCTVILEKLPNCVRANAIMSDLLLGMGREEDAAPYLQRWQELTPYETQDLQPVVSGGGWAPAQKAPPVSLALPYLEWTPPARGDSELEAPEWVRELGLALGEQGGGAKTSAPEPAAEEVMPDWLRSAAAPAQAPAAPALQNLQGDAAVPDWLRAAEVESRSPQPPAAAEAAAPAAAEEVAPDWLRELGGEAGMPFDEATAAALGESAIQDDLPDWLRGAGEEQEEQTAEPAATAAALAPALAAAPSHETTAAPAEDDALDWMREVSPQPSGAAAAPPDEEVPDWLASLMSSTQDAAPAAAPAEALAAAAPAEALAAAAPQSAGPTMEEDPMAWLERLAAGQGAPLEELPSMTQAPAAPAAPQAAEGEPPDWLRDAAVTPAPEQAAAPAESAGVPSIEDDPMAWLEHLAAQQGAPLEELPSLSKAPQAPPVAPAPAAQAEPAQPAEEELPDWLRGIADSSATAAEPAQPLEQEMPDWLRAVEELPSITAAPPAAPASAEPAPEAAPPAAAPAAADAEAPVAPAELSAGPSMEEDPMAWLERLAAQQGAPLEELPSISAAPAEPQAAPAAPAQAELPDWLREAAESRASEAAPAAAVEAAAQVTPAPAELSAGPSMEEDPMAWLERLAAQQGAPLEELPSMTAAPPAASAPAPAAPAEEDLGEMPEDPEAARAWLERVMEREGRDTPAGPAVEAAPAAEAPAQAPLPAIPDEPLGAPEAAIHEDLPDWLREVSGPAPSVEAALGPAADEDPMAWLERLAAQQGAPLEELPSMTQAPAAPAEPELAAKDDTPEWLRSALDEGPVVAAPEPAAETEAAEPAAEAPSEEDAMAWLERLAARQGAPLEELPSVSGQPESQPVDSGMPSWLNAEMGAAPEPEPAPVPQVPGDNELQVTALPPLGEQSEGMDEGADIMAWLERLAARQGAPLEELPSITDAVAPPTEPEVPAWVKQQIAAAPPAAPVVQAPPVESPVDSPVEPPAAAQPLPEAGAPLSAPEELRLEEPPAEKPWSPQAVEELRVEPEELAPIDEGPAIPGEAVGDWVHEVELEKAAAQPEPVAAPAAPAPAGEAGIEQLRAQLKKTPKDYAARLQLARLLLAEGNAPEAVKQYDMLIKASSRLQDVIADLTTALEQEPDNAKVRRALGDAYNYDGQFQKALELYRASLKNLKK